MKVSASDPQAVGIGLRALMVVCALAVVSLLYLPLPILGVLKQSHSIDATGMVSSFGFAYAAGFLIFGPLSDRVGRRNVMVAGLLALVSATVVLAVASTSWSLMVGRVLQGLAASSFPPVAIAYLAERGSPRQRVWSVAWMSTAFLSAGLLGQIYGGLVAGPWGLAAAFWPLCLVFALTAWCLWKKPADMQAGQGLSGFFSNYKAIGGLLADARLRRVYLPAFFLLMCFVAFYMALDSKLGMQFAQLGMSPLMTRAVVAPVFLMPLLVAVVMPKLGPQRTLCSGLACAAAGLALSAWAGEEHLMALLGASFLFVAGLGISVPSLIARVAAVSDISVRGLAVSLYTFVLFIGASLGPWLAQQTADMTLASTYLLLAGVLAICAIYAVFSN
ncbi:MFS transporter [Alcaligenes faecalis]|uniref:MFS transporter n=1 Tax=Alcaligenes TaxID=507 RepID=UPI00203FB1B7|nr:MFS transporter [Alcaligenes faecalis]MCM2559654.1 MFS transporter [Alcaligenes faecalis]MCM2622320.1 MFS transporter [Alcaligenes faecalis]MDK7587639.1 MFS transporter [Alcaligenes phenolicus]